MLRALAESAEQFKLAALNKMSAVPAFTVAGATAVGLYAAYRVMSRMFSSGGMCSEGVDARDLAGRVCSAIHASTVAPIAAATACGAVGPWLGAVGMGLSIGYFLSDSIVIADTSESPVLFWVHHALSAGCLSATLLAAPQCIWHASLLQCVEATIPIQFGAWLLEVRGADKTRPGLYAGVRWLMAIAWVAMRLVVPAGFVVVVSREWASLAAPPRLIACAIAPFVVAFNVGGLFKVVLPGLPGLPRWGQSRRSGKQD